MTELSRRSMIAALSLGGVAAFAPAVRAAEKSKENLPAGAETFDVVVAGGGAAGCMAARTASKAGKKVLLVQSLPMLGGSSAISPAKPSGTRPAASRTPKRPTPRTSSPTARVPAIPRRPR